MKDDGGPSARARAEMRIDDMYAEAVKQPSTANGKTFRLVTETNGTVEASCGLLTPSEASDMLGVEVTLHRLYGWSVRVCEGRVECERGTSRRVVRIEEV